MKADADHTFGNVRSTCDLADQVSGKVCELDLAQSRLDVTLSHIDAIVESGAHKDVSPDRFAVQGFWF